MPAGKPEKEAEARGPELRPRVLGGEEIVYSKQNRSLRCVYTEIGRNIFYRFFVGLLWNTNGSEETHPPLSLAARKGVLWLCFGLLRLLYQPRVALYEFLIPLVLAHRLQKVFPMPMCHRSTVVCWFWETTEGREKRRQRGMPFPLSHKRVKRLAHPVGTRGARQRRERRERAARAQPRSRGGSSKCVRTFGFP